MLSSRFSNQKYHIYCTCIKQEHLMQFGIIFDEFKIHQALFLHFQSLSFVYKNDDLCLYKFAGGNIGGFSGQLFHSL